MSALAANNLKRSVINAWHGNMKFYLLKWKDNVELIKEKEDGIALLMKRCRQVTLRACFEKYRRGVRFNKWDENNEKKIQNAMIRIKYNYKKRIFLALKSYQVNYSNAKSFIRNMIQRYDKKKKRQALKLWHEFKIGAVDSTL
jgi:hypothetical protein